MYRYTLMVGAIFFVSAHLSLRAQNSEIKEISSQQVEFQKVPAQIRNTYKSGNYDDYRVIRSERVQTGEHGLLYKLKVENSHQQYYLYYNRKAKLVSTDKIDPNESE